MQKINRTPGVSICSKFSTLKSAFSDRHSAESMFLVCIRNVRWSDRQVARLCELMFFLSSTFSTLLYNVKSVALAIRVDPSHL